MAEEPQKIEEFELAYFANIPDSYGYVQSKGRYMFHINMVFHRQNSPVWAYTTELGNVGARNSRIKKVIMETYTEKNGEEPPSFEVAFYDFWGEKSVNFKPDRERWQFTQPKLSWRGYVAFLPYASLSCLTKEAALKARNDHIRKYLIGKYRQVDDLTKKMETAKLEDSDSVESVDLDDYVLKTEANERFRKLKKAFRAELKKKDAEIEELKMKLMAALQPPEEPPEEPKKTKEETDSDDSFGLDEEVCAVCSVTLGMDDDKHYCDTQDNWFCPTCFPGYCGDEECDGCATTFEETM